MGKMIYRTAVFKMRTSYQIHLRIAFSINSYPFQRGSIQIPACVGLTTGDCLFYAQQIYSKHPSQFGSSAGFTRDVNNLAESIGYYFVGIPVNANDENPPVAGNGKFAIIVQCPLPFNLYTMHGSHRLSIILIGLVHYPYDWCVDMTGPVTPKCKSIGPWDCSGLDANACCLKIGLEYPGEDLSGNDLQCYKHELGGNGHETCLMSSVVTMHVNHINYDNIVAIPASIPVAPIQNNACEYASVTPV